MEEIINKYEPERVEVAKKCGILLGVGIGLMILAFVFFAIGSACEVVALFIVGFISIVIGIILIVVSTIKGNKFKAKLQKELLSAIMMKTYEDITYFPNKGIDEATLMKPNFFVKADRFTSSNLFNARYETTKFTMSDYQIEKMRVYSDGKNVNTQYQVVARGRFFVFDFERDFKNTVKVLEKAFFASGKASNLLSGLSKVELESIEFNKKFQTLSNDQTTAFYILTPQVQEKMLELEQLFHGEIYFCFDKHYLYIAVNDHKSSFSISLYKKISDEVLNRIVKEVSIPKSFIDALKLNREKYNRDSTSENL